MATNVEADLQSVAPIEAAMRSSGRGEAVAVQELLERARSAVETGWLEAIGCSVSRRREFGR